MEIEDHISNQQSQEITHTIVVEGFKEKYTEIIFLFLPKQHSSLSSDVFPVILLCS